MENVLARGKYSITGQPFNISIYYDNIGYVQERSKVSITRVYTKLSFHEAQLLEVSGLLDTSLKELTHLDDASVEDKDKVRLEGTETDVKAVEDKIDQFKSQIVQKRIECSAAKISYLLSLDGKAHTMAKMREKNIQTIWYSHHRELMVIARSRSDLEQTKSWIAKHIFEIKHDVIEGSQQMIESKLDALRQDSVKQHGIGSFCFDYTPGNRCITVVAQHEVIFHIEEVLKTSFPKPMPVMKKERLRLPLHQQKFLWKYMTERIHKIEKVQIIWKDNLFWLSGQTESIQSAVEEFNRFSKRIHESEMKIVCGNMKIPLDEAISCFVDYVERTERCIITWQFVRQEESMGATGRSVVKNDSENPRHEVEDHEKVESARNEATGGRRGDIAHQRVGQSSRRNRSKSHD